MEWLSRESEFLATLLLFPLAFWSVGFFWCLERVNSWLYRRACDFRRRRGYWRALGPLSRD
jgi:hypothetical protein